jgi:voltage-gated potassium channel
MQNDSTEPDRGAGEGGTLPGRLKSAASHGLATLRKPSPDFRRRVFEVLELARGEDALSSRIDGFLIALIVLNVLAFVAETVPSIEAGWGGWLKAFEIFSVIVFTIEYSARIWSSVEASFLKRLPPWQARLRFAMRGDLLIDLAAILPFYLSFLLPIDLRLLRVLRLVRFLKLSRYSPAMSTIIRVLVNERRALYGALLLVLTALLFSSTAMYYIEQDAQPEKFGSIPDAAYWAIVTLTTVGYGDVTPVTPMGKLFAGITMLMGLVVLALPIAVIATGFAQEVGRRDFVLTWSMLSRIPMFSELDAKSVGEVMRCLSAHNYPPHHEILARDHESEAMFFIASGKVRAEAGEAQAELGSGESFGELGMLDHAPSERTYTAASRVRVLRLDRDGYNQLASAYPAIGREIRELGERRKVEALGRNAAGQ